MNTSERLLIELIRDPGDECIEWSGAKSSNGYGKVSSGGKVVLATRYAKAYADGIEIPPRTTVCRHTCDNPPCVNPNHLLWGTMKENAKDSFDRERAAVGNRLPQSKMTPELVVEARAYFLEVRSLKKTRERYNLAINPCRQMLLGHTWAHVPGAISHETYSDITKRKSRKESEYQWKSIQKS